MEEAELEMEQLDYLRRNAQQFNVPDETIMYPDQLKQPLERPIILNRDQEKKIIDEIKRQIPSTEIHKTVKRSFSLSLYMDILSSSFVGIMDDLLNFDGNLERIQEIFTKEDRLVFIATLVIIISFLLFSTQLKLETPHKLN